VWKIPARVSLVFVAIEAAVLAGCTSPGWADGKGRHRPRSSSPPAPGRLAHRRSRCLCQHETFRPCSICCWHRKIKLYNYFLILGFAAWSGDFINLQARN